MIKRVFYIPVLLVFLFFLSCKGKYSEECDTSIYCEKDKPDSSILTLKVTYAVGNPVPVEVYEGYIDNGSLYFRDTLYEGEVAYYVPIDKRYAARAFYLQNGQPVVTTDGNRLKVQTFWNCEERCYDLDGIALDLELLR